MAINEQDLQRALSLRISMQIAVSSIPAVEESMDIDLDRFLDSVPLPPEVPSGTAIDIEVTVGSDLQRMRWSAFGHPAGFIPKMADYLNRCGVQPVDIALINGMGDALQPSLVGHWVAIEDGAVRTGWQFREQRALAELQPFLGSEFAVAKMMAWAVRRDVDFYRGFARSIGKEPSSRVEVPLPGATAAEQLELARSAFEDLLEQPLPAQLIDAIGESEAPDTGLAFELVGGELRGLAVVASGFADDVVAGLCHAVGVTWSDTLPRIGQALRADGITRVEYRRRGEVQAVDALFIPGETEPAPPGTGSN